MLMRMDVARHIFSHTDQKKDGYADQKDLKDGYAASGYAEVHDHNNMPDDTVTLAHAVHRAVLHAQQHAG